MATRGLVNVGNSCYFNTCIQILVRIPTVAAALNTYVEGSDHSTRVLHALRELGAALPRPRSDDRTVNPIACLTTLHSSSFDTKSGMQHDLSEVLLILLDHVHNATRRDVRGTAGCAELRAEMMKARPPREIAVIKHMLEDAAQEHSPVFSGLIFFSFTEIRHAGSGKVMADTLERNMQLHLPTGGAPGTAGTTLEHCLALYTRGERISGWSDEDGGRHDVVKRTVIWALPTTLVIILKRFKPSATGFKKDRRVVDCPLVLDVSSLTETTTGPYALCAVGNHSGKMDGGHYWCTVRDYGAWYRYDDQSIVPVAEGDVISHHAYCLVYRKNSSVG